MESLSLLKPRVPKTAPKLVKTIAEPGEGGVFGQLFRFPLDPSHGNLLQQYLRIKITADVDPLTPAPFIFNAQLALDIFKTVRLVSSRGPIQSIDKTTLIGRMGLIYGTSLYNRIMKGIEGDADLLVDGQYLYLPLFWFFSDLTKDMLNLTEYDQLWVEALTGKNGTDMGFGADVIVSEISVDLFSRFAQTEVGEKIALSPSSYSSFTEDEVVVTLTEEFTTIPILLRCPYEVFYMHIYAPVVDSQGSATITNVKLDCPTSVLFDMDFKLNYLIRSDESYDTSEDAALSFWFGDRHGDFKDFITFGREMTPTWAYVTIQGNVGTTYAVRTSCEYRTKLKVSEGIIMNVTAAEILS